MPRNTFILLVLMVGILVGVMVFTRSRKETPTGVEQVNAKPQALPEQMGGRSAVGPPRPLEAEPAGARIAALLTTENEWAGLLSQEEIAAYLEANKTNAVSLLSAFQATRNLDFLREAAANFPEDPLVQSQVLVHDLFPEKRQEWVNAMKQSDPNNSLPYLWEAQARMKSGDLQGALEEIAGSAGKQFNDYTRERSAGLEEAYVSAGRDLAEAKALGTAGLQLPHLAPFKSLGTQLADLAVQYRDQGDTAGQQALLTASWDVGTHLREYGEKSTIITDLVGLALQNQALRRWPEGAEAGFLQGESVADRLAKHTAYRADIRSSTDLVEQWLPTASENELITYFDRLRTFGEMDAINWLKNRQGE